MTEVIDPPTGDAPPSARRKPRRRISFWIGLGLVLVGLGILAWLAWQIWGTNWISQREERHEVKLFERGTFGPPALLEVPRFGADYVVPINDMPIKGDPSDVLAKGVGHFAGLGPIVNGKRTTIGPGQIGNYALAGHRITHGQPFANLPDLRPGDKVFVITHKVTYEYVMDTNPNALVVPFTASWVLAMDPANPNGVGPQAIQGPDERIITLTTCSELFHTDNRLVAFGHLLKSFKTNPVNPTKIVP
ncbi:MAG: sortase domain-containing protein [Marmoricola sp.]